MRIMKLLAVLGVMALSAVAAVAETTWPQNTWPQDTWPEQLENAVRTETEKQSAEQNKAFRSIVAIPGKYGFMPGVLIAQNLVEGPVMPEDEGGPFSAYLLKDVKKEAGKWNFNLGKTETFSASSERNAHQMHMKLNKKVNSERVLPVCGGKISDIHEVLILDSNWKVYPSSLTPDFDDRQGKTFFFKGKDASSFIIFNKEATCMVGVGQRTMGVFIGVRATLEPLWPSLDKI